MSLALYSPINFIVGLRTWLEMRSRMTGAQAIAEADELLPGWRHRLLGAILTGLVILYAFQVLIPGTAGPVTAYAASKMTALQVASLVGLIVCGFFAWLIARALLRAANFYVEMCRIGAATRAA